MDFDFTEPVHDRALFSLGVIGVLMAVSFLFPHLFGAGGGDPTQDTPIR